MSRLIEFAIEHGPMVPDSLVVGFCIGFAVCAILVTAFVL